MTQCSKPYVSPPSFIADTMLGKLARWMSILGYDIVYAGLIEDDVLVEKARESGRVICTRDTRISRNWTDVDVFLIHSTKFWEQIQEVILSYPMDFSRTAFTRCSRCNVVIERVEKSAVLHKLPPLVSQNQEIIYQCPACGNLYWHASHVDHMRALLREHLGIDIVSPNP